MGRAWFGYEGGTIILLKNENILKVFPADESPVGSVSSITGRGRHIWVGGSLGLAFFDGNCFRRIVPADAETFGSVLGVEESSDGSMWLAEDRDVSQVPASEVQQALDNPSYRVKYRTFDSFDGLPGTFAGVTTNSREIQGTDGKLWFVASNGLVWVDPANISTNALPPPVLIRSVSANGRQAGSLTNLALPPRTTNLQSTIRGLNVTRPEIYFGDERLAKVPRGPRIAVHCAGGYRSSIAISILHQHGITNLIEMAGGIAAWDAAKLPVASAI
jgi:rhodanese-related sulfurtransferase